MFNPLTRTLKLGLTAITILTAGVGVAFAPTVAEAATAAQIARCNSNPFGTSTSYGTGGCGVTLGTEQFSTAKEQYCDKDINRSKPICRPTAVRWRFENPAAPTSPDTANRRDQFLQGTPTGVNQGTRLRGAETVSLNLSTAKFGRGSGEALGGSATDGVSFFTGYTGSLVAGYEGTHYGYAGIFSGTDLGAPIAETSGTAKWVGRFSGLSHLQGGWVAYVGKDFILEVDYATKSLDAFIPRVNDSSGNIGYYQLDGQYDSNGIITGKFELSGYNNADRTNINFAIQEGSVTGLIGKKGAVGAFHSGNTGSSSRPVLVYAGGFVARPAGDVTGAETYLNEKCVADPFHYLCFTSNQRATRILADCRATRTSTPTHCSDATVACVNDPFGADCHKTLGGYALNIARTKRVAFCNITTNSGNLLCTGANLTNLCGYAPFSQLCLGKSEYSSERARLFESCRNDPNNLICNGVSQELSDKKPNTANWLDSFVTSENPNELPSVVDTATRSQFLKGRKTDLNETGITNVKARGALYFETAPVEDTPVSLLLATNPEPTDTEIAKEGVAFFWGWERSKYAFYAGILEGTDLGAPVKSVSGTKATWNGKFQSLWFTTETDFELKIVFGDDNNGTIKAAIANNGDKTFFSHFFIDGKFDNNGLITGDILAGTFTDENPKTPIGTPYPGILRGLIGKEGAVGAFVGGTSTDEGNTITGTSIYSGGFIATPPPVVNYTDWEAVADPTDTPTANRFFAGTPDLIFREGGILPNRKVKLGRFSGRESELSLPSGTGDIKNGFFIYTPTDGNNYAGLLSTTNLGAPLDATTAVGVWRGFFEQQTGNGPLKSTTFTLNVNFGAGASSTQAGTISGNGEGANSAYAFTNVPFSTMGVIDGVITYTNPTDAVVSNGVITGLIGVKGAVGVFHSNVGATTSYIGGFLAHKASP